MSRTYKDSKQARARRRHRNSVRCVQKDAAQLRKLSRAVIELALAEAEAESVARGIGTTPPADKSDHQPKDADV